MNDLKPFFSVGGGDPSLPRIMLVSWHFPPGSSAGALRWERLAEHAFQRGWELDVLTLHPDDLDRRDDARLANLPPGTRVFGVRSSQPPEARLDSFLHDAWRRMRASDDERPKDGDADCLSDADSGPMDLPGSLARDDVRLRPWSIRDLRRAWFAWLEWRRETRWAAEATSVGRRVLSASDRARIIVSCGPPHMAHEAARRLAVSLSLPFAMDLRDPWSQVQRLPEHLASPVWYGLAAYHEWRCVRAAVLVVANTEPARDALAAAYPSVADRTIAVMNGFDDDPIRLPDERCERFVIAHAGTVYLDRDPRPLFRAIARLAEERQLQPDRLGVRFFGCTDDGIRRMARGEGVESYIDLVPFLPREELRHRLADCAVLVVLPQDSDLAIPSKAFDYMRYPAWILAMAEDDSATGTVLRGTPAVVVSADDVDGLTRQLSDWFEEFQQGMRPVRVAEVAPALSRRMQAARLFDRLESYRSGDSESSSA